MHKLSSNIGKRIQAPQALNSTNIARLKKVESILPTFIELNNLPSTFSKKLAIQSTAI